MAASAVSFSTILFGSSLIISDVLLFISLTVLTAESFSSPIFSFNLLTVPLPDTKPAAVIGVCINIELPGAANAPTATSSAIFASCSFVNAFASSPVKLYVFNVSIKLWTDSWPASPAAPADNLVAVPNKPPAIFDATFCGNFDNVLSTTLDTSGIPLTIDMSANFSNLKLSIFIIAAPVNSSAVICLPVFS